MDRDSRASDGRKEKDQRGDLPKEEREKTKRVEEVSLERLSEWCGPFSHPEEEFSSFLHKIEKSLFHWKSFAKVAAFEDQRM